MNNFDSYTPPYIATQSINYVPDCSDLCHPINDTRNNKNKADNDDG